MGELANLVINGTFVLVLGIIYKVNKTRKAAVIGFASATVLYTLAAMAANYFLMFPLYMPDAPMEVIASIILTTVTPFNIVKGIVLSVITLLIYKKISPVIKGK